jgi:hypothetical protein
MHKDTSVIVAYVLATSPLPIRVLASYEIGGDGDTLATQ